MQLAKGQQLWCVPIHWQSTDKPYYVTVLKVGRRWAHLSNHRRISITSLIEEDQPSTSRSDYYMKREEYNSKLEKEKAWKNLGLFIESRSQQSIPENVSLENIKAAGELLGFNSV